MVSSPLLPSLTNTRFCGGQPLALQQRESRRSRAGGNRGAKKFFIFAPFAALLSAHSRPSRCSTQWRKRSGSRHCWAKLRRRTSANQGGIRHWADAADLGSEREVKFSRRLRGRSRKWVTKLDERRRRGDECRRASRPWRPSLSEWSKSYLRLPPEIPPTAVAPVDVDTQSNE